MRARFLPTARQANWLISIGFLALFYALYLRYWGIENTPLGLACDAGLGTSLCLIRRVVYTFGAHLVFGWIAVGAAVMNLIRPSPAIFAITLAASAFGSRPLQCRPRRPGRGLFIMSFARPAAEPE